MDVLDEMEDKESAVTEAFVSFKTFSEERADFTGNLSDITVLAHEFGHAYHRYCLGNKKM